MNEIKNMWKHNPFAAAMSLAGAVMILMPVFISDYYNIRNTFFSDIVFSGVIVMLAGAYIYIFHSADRKKPYDETLRLIHKPVKNENTDAPKPVEDSVNAEYMRGYIQALSDHHLISHKHSINLQEALKKTDELNP